jgi:DNA-binding GntR family transcriptional regulator
MLMRAKVQKIPAPNEVPALKTSRAKRRGRATPSFSRTDWLTEILRDRVLKGRYRPGDRIREADLQAEFNLSNGPIREAIQRLVADGIFQRGPWRGAQVIELTESEIVELFQVRLALLEYAAELAANRATEATAAEAKAVREKLAIALSKVKAGKLDLMNGDLVQWIFRAAGNSRLRDLWDRTMLQARVYVYESMRLTGAMKTEGLQYRMLDAIAAGDAGAARQAVRDLTRQILLDLKIDAKV